MVGTIVPLLVMVGGGLMILLAIPVTFVAATAIQLLRSFISALAPRLSRLVAAGAERIARRGYTQDATVVAVLVASTALSLSAPVHAIKERTHNTVDAAGH
ncbi:MAG TPA: hypothetical protein VFE65_09205 [Pseudonocardia sp.]|jgi:hypothetical protein|nr:hypothetical protein [Pseudonocardia sp.]